MLAGMSLSFAPFKPDSLEFLKGISYIDPCKKFDKSNTIANVCNYLFKFHRSYFHSYIDIYINSSKENNLVGCGIVCKNTVLSYHWNTCIVFWIPCCRAWSEAHLPILSETFPHLFLSSEMSLKRFNQTYAHHYSSLFYNFITNFEIRISHFILFGFCT